MFEVLIFLLNALDLGVFVITSRLKAYYFF